MKRSIYIHKYLIKKINPNHVVCCIVLLHLYSLYNIAVDRLTTHFDEHNNTYTRTHVIIMRLTILNFVTNDLIYRIIYLYCIFLLQRRRTYSIAHGVYNSTMRIFAFLARLHPPLPPIPTRTRRRVGKYPRTYN